MEIFIQQQKVRLRPQQLIGQGGEAEVYRLAANTALKLFKPDSHPDYAGNPQAQAAARERLAQHQQKLRQFPRHLPSRVVAPEQLACDRSGQQILGYTMPLLAGAEVLWRYSQRQFRQSIDSQTVVAIFLDLHRTLTQLHRSQVVIGDFNDLNVLVQGTAAYLIDTDSFQFGAFPCPMFTARFVDPCCCAPQAPPLQLQRPHSCDSDWYAFTVMLMQCLLFVDPYGGLYQPRDPGQRLPAAARPLHRITVFHPEVRYPKPARPYNSLPDDLLHHLHQVFEQDWRGPFPRSLLDRLHWSTCPSCGLEHGRSHCPQCAQPQITPIMAPAAAMMVPVFNTSGLICYVCQHRGQLQWVYWHQGYFRREDDSPLLQGDLGPNLRWRIEGRQTELGCSNQVVSLQPDQPPQRLTVDSYGPIPQFDRQADGRYWLDQGYLWRQGRVGPQVVGAVLAGGQTQFWVGPTFGFGFYRAGDLSRAFVFAVGQSGLNDQVSFPSWAGVLLQATCSFSDQFCWLFLTTQEQGLRYYHCRVISPQGTVVAMATSDQHQRHWLTQLGASLGTAADPCPFCAVDDGLLAATDEGILRIQIQAGQLVCTRRFTETEPLVDASCRLLAGPQGLWVIRDRRIDWLPWGQEIGAGR